MMIEIAAVIIAINTKRSIVFHFDFACCFCDETTLPLTKNRPDSVISQITSDPIFASLASIIT